MGTEDGLLNFQHAHPRTGSGQVRFAIYACFFFFFFVAEIVFLFLFKEQEWQDNHAHIRTPSCQFLSCLSAFDCLADCFYREKWLGKSGGSRAPITTVRFVLVPSAIFNMRVAKTMDILSGAPTHR
ncbi:hypothetical protein ANAPC5_01505 [Anaplasma phagocytophilum]|nr:hypothetical protein ANAPC5_01505 [Anaplasma phagocytophilum]